MRAPVAVIDTNVIVAGLITSKPGSPTARILDGMLQGQFPFLLSVELLAEYRAVLLRSRIRRAHRLEEEEVDIILTEIAANGKICEPEGCGSPGRPPPDRGDIHLWALLGARPGSVLVSGDRALIDNPPEDTRVLSPRRFLKELGWD